MQVSIVVLYIEEKMRFPKGNMMFYIVIEVMLERINTRIDLIKIIC